MSIEKLAGDAGAEIGGQIGEAGGAAAGEVIAGPVGAKIGAEIGKQVGKDVGAKAGKEAGGKLSSPGGGTGSYDDVKSMLMTSMDKLGASLEKSQSSGKEPTPEVEETAESDMKLGM